MVARQRRCIALIAILISIANPCLAAQPVETIPPPPFLQTYQLDPDETHSRFEVKFMGFITVRGKFNRTTGTLVRDPQLQRSSIHAIIDTTTLHAQVANAGTTNRILRGPEFFQVDKFPAIEFKSSLFVYEGERLQRIEGMLTLLGVTRPVALLVAASRCVPADAERKARCEADAAVTVRRSEFGMLGWNESVADEVKISVALVAIEAARELPPLKVEPAAAVAKPAP